MIKHLWNAQRCALPSAVDLVALASAFIQTPPTPLMIPNAENSEGGMTGLMLGILYTFWGMGFLIYMKKGSFFLPRLM